MQAMSVVEAFLAQHIRFIELSGGMYDRLFETRLRRLAKRGVFQFHNYSPPPTEPFVMNLGSVNPQILEKSRSLALQAIEYSARVGSSVYSVHAPFLVDLEISELGSTIRKATSGSNRTLVVSNFLDSISLLHSRADTLNIRILVENNVLTSENYSPQSACPLLFVEPREIVEVLHLMAGRAGLLLDLGHLAVSCDTLGLDLNRAIEELLPFAELLHLSDNDGTADAGEPLSESTWFLPYLQQLKCDVVLELSGVSALEMAWQVDFVSDLTGADGRSL